MDLALGAGTGSSSGLLAPVRVCFVTFDLIKASLSCAGFVDSSISGHLHRSCSPCAHSFAKGCSSALELTATVGQGRCPWWSLGWSQQKGDRCWTCFSPGRPCAASSSMAPELSVCLGSCSAGLAPGCAMGGYRCPWPWESSWDRWELSLHL